MGKMTASKAVNLAAEYNLNIHDTNEINPCEFDHSSGQNDTTLFTFQSITTGDVQRIIKSLPSNKAPGCDKVNAKILKDSLPVIAPIITSIMNNSFSSSTFPLLWKKAEIVPILKSGDSEEPANTRPISLLPILSKVCERAANLTCSSSISSIQIISYITCKVEIENVLQLSLRYFTLPTNCLITWIKRRYLLLFSWTCLKLSTASGTT